MWGSGDIAPLILNIATRWRREVSFTLGFGREKNPLFPLGIEPESSNL
jgi:hypothetical protein